MSLNNFFSINLPYGLAINNKGKWTVFNREYMPLGFNDMNFKTQFFPKYNYNELPIYTEYIGLTDAILMKLADNEESKVKRNSEGKITMAFLYNDANDPTKKGGIVTKIIKMAHYLRKIKILSSLDVK